MNVNGYVHFSLFGTREEYSKAIAQGRQLPIAHCPLLTANCPLQTTHSLLLTAFLTLPCCLRRAFASSYGTFS
ncbi:MAG TPA: hypothetical protein PLE71_17580, partial [Flavobacteriales bacterium]|nr:hypothetical protein [Flavobacteriales bacterium]